MIPIRERKYYPYPDMDVHYNIPRTKKLFVVDLRDMTLVTREKAIPSSFTAVFSQLAPRNTEHDLIFPGILWPDSFGPLDLPHVSAQTIGDRYYGLRKIRKSLVHFISRVREVLNPWQLHEIESPLITLYRRSGDRLVENPVNRAMFFRIIHPTFNPLLTSAEATFLRGACYALQRFHFTLRASTIDHVLRMPQYDAHVCFKLLGMGCLDRDDREERTFCFLEDYEAQAQGDSYVSDSDED
jgi:hypothetical protein